MIKVLLLLPVVAAGLYALLVGLVYFGQRRLQYRPTHNDSEGKGNGALRPWKNSQGEFVGYVRPTERPKKIILIFHGNGGEALDRAWMAELAGSSDLCLLAEYPGFGARKGVASEAAILKDAEAMISEIEHKWGRLPIVVVGESLGTGVACYLASKHLVSRVGLISPFTSALDVAKSVYRFLPVAWLMQDRFLSEEFLKTSTAPLFVIHGTLDETIPMQMGKRLVEGYKPADKHFTEIPGFGHGQLDWPILHSPFCEEFRNFLSQ